MHSGNDRLLQKYEHYKICLFDFDCCIYKNRRLRQVCLKISTLVLCTEFANLVKVQPDKSLQDRHIEGVTPIGG